MKSQIAAGTTRIGQYSYQNMNRDLITIRAYAYVTSRVFAPAGELLAVMAAFRRGGVIAGTAQAQSMLDDGFGIDWSEPTPLGRYYAKNGFWYDGAGQMEQGVAFFLPQDTELVVLVNSPVGSTGEFLYTIVSETFTAHIEELSLLPGIS